MGKFYEACAARLELHVRYLAWLGATLDVPKSKSKPGSNQRNVAQDAPKPVTRKQKFGAEGIDYTLPELGAEAWLLDILFDAGPVKPAGMGFAPLDYGDIAAWERAFGVELNAWERGVLRRISRAYHHTSHESGDPACAAPGSVEESPEDAEQRRKRVADGLAAQLRMLRDTKPKR